jgi:hypothetical protein
MAADAASIRFDRLSTRRSAASSVTLPQPADPRVALAARQGFAACQPTTDPAIRNAEGYKVRCGPI